VHVFFVHHNWRSDLTTTAVTRPPAKLPGVAQKSIMNVLIGFAWALGAVLLFLIVLSVLAFVADRDWSNED
jgi:hypothetical protein